MTAAVPVGSVVEVGGETWTLTDHSWGTRWECDGIIAAATFDDALTALWLARRALDAALGALVGGA